MPDVTHHEIRRLQSAFTETLSILNNQTLSKIDQCNRLIVSLDHIQQHVAKLRKSIILGTDKPADIADEILIFFKETVLPALRSHILKSHSSISREAIEWHFYSSISCVTGLIADVLGAANNLEFDASTRASGLIEIDTASKLLHDYKYLEWSEGYAAAIKNDLEHIFQVDQDKSAYKDCARIRMRIYAFLANPIDKNAKELISTLNKVVNKHIVLDDINVGRNHSDVYFQLICLMRLCLQSMPVSVAGNAVNTAYAKMLLKMLHHHAYSRHGLVYSELKNSLVNQNGMESKAFNAVQQYIHDYEEGPTGLKRFAADTSLVNHVVKAQVRSLALHVCNKDSEFLQMRSRAHHGSVTGIGIFAIDKSERGLPVTAVKMGHRKQ